MKRRKFLLSTQKSEEEMAEKFSPQELALLFENNSFVGPPIDIESALKKLNR